MSLLELLKQIDQLQAEINSIRPLDSAQEKRIMQRFRLDWTYHSNSIEGNTLTYGETRAFLLHGITAQGKPFRDYLEIKGHYEAIDYLLDFVRQERPLTEADIRELHRIILVEPYQMNTQTSDGTPVRRRIQPGQYKTMPNHVYTSTGGVHYYATPEETPGKMGNLIAWYRRETEKGELHPVVLAATFHYQFVIIHPFDDGNGRMARLLMNLILMRFGNPPAVIHTSTKENYLLALEKADADDDLEPFITLVGESLVQSLKLYLRAARGEAIEELADLDKKLALLAKKAAMYKKEDEESAIAFEEKKTRLLTDVIHPFLSQLLLQFNKFNQFFQEYSCVSSTGGKDIHFSTDEVDKLIEHLANVLGKLSPVQIRYQWKSFNFDETFDLWFVLDFHLEKDVFTIAYHFDSESDIILKGTYNQKISSQDLEQHAITITNKVYNVIEQKITT